MKSGPEYVTAHNPQGRTLRIVSNKEYNDVKNATNIAVTVIELPFKATRLVLGVVGTVICKNF